MHLNEMIIFEEPTHVKNRLKMHESIECNNRFEKHINREYKQRGNVYDYPLHI